MKLSTLVTTLGAVSVCFLGACGSEDQTTSWVKKPDASTSTDGGASDGLAGDAKAGDSSAGDAVGDKSTATDSTPSDVSLDKSVGDSNPDQSVVPDAKVDAPPEAAAIDADFTYEGGAVTPWEALPKKCTEAAEKGVVWLVQQQKSDGSWGSGGGNAYSLAATGLAIVKLETYAIEHGKSPFHATFQYNANVVSGLNYLFQTISTPAMAGAMDTNGDGLGATVSGQTNYVSAIVLMAIAAGQGFNQTVNSPGSPVNGWKYQRVAQNMVDFFSECQTSQGGWRYSCPSGNADNSVSQYVSLALEYADHPDYQFLCTIPPSVPTGLANFVSSVQDMNAGSPNYGGSGYTSTGDSVNPYKTGAVLQELAFLKQGPSTQKVQAAVQYLDTNWASHIAGNPADYMSMWAIMKGLVTQGIDTVGTHDWYTEYCDLLVSQQNANGSWPQTSWDNAASEGVLSTSWALLILEKAAPAKLY